MSPTVASRLTTRRGRHAKSTYSGSRRRAESTERNQLNPSSDSTDPLSHPRTAIKETVLVWPAPPDRANQTKIADATAAAATAAARLTGAPTGSRPAAARRSRDCLGDAPMPGAGDRLGRGGIEDVMVCVPQPCAGERCDGAVTLGPIDVRELSPALARLNHIPHLWSCSPLQKKTSTQNPIASTGTLPVSNRYMGDSVDEPIVAC